MIKRALLTGGSRGLGLAICRRLLADGFHVNVASRRISSELAELLATHSEQVEHHPVDFSDPNASRALIKSARLLDGVDAFIANAAIGTEGLLTLTSEAAIRECVEVNLIAPLLISRDVIKGMLGRGGGSLVFVASVAARTGLAGLAAYAATKGGLVSLSRTLAREYGKKGIRSNAVLPGFLDTEMSAGLGAVAQDRVVRRTALKRLGTVDDVTGVISFLISDASSYVTGTEIVADGGLTA